MCAQYIQTLTPEQDLSGDAPVKPSWGRTLARLNLLISLFRYRHGVYPGSFGVLSDGGRGWLISFSTYVKVPI
jgi:hypothetical protein